MADLFPPRLAAAAAGQRTVATTQRRLGVARRGAAERRARKRVEAWTRERFALEPGDTVLVAELACASPGCPPRETVVAFWSESEPRRQFRVFKRVEDVAAEDLPPRWMKPALVFVEGAGCDCC